MLSWSSPALVLVRGRSAAAAAPLLARVGASSPPCPPRRFLATKAEDELIAANRSLLAAISSGDWKKYAELVSADSTCIEPETSKQIVSGLDFHRFYFDLPGDPNAKPEPKNTTMADIHAKVIGSLGYLTYNRVTQVGLKTSVAQETRCWEKSRADGQWRMVHFHKSV
jgi:hypothetical protein